MRLLVTGGAGYIGSHTVLMLLEAGHEVVVVDNLSNSKEEALRRVGELTSRPIAFHRVDLLDADALDAVFRPAMIKTFFILHLPVFKFYRFTISKTC